MHVGDYTAATVYPGVMRLKIVSDLHLEFHADGGRTILGEIAEGEFDVLVVAGDLVSADGVLQSVRMLLEAVRQPVIYVAGNHDYYGGDYATTNVRLRSFEHSHPGRFHLLDESSVRLCGRRFIGCTLWFPYDRPHPLDDCLNDFHLIRGFQDWVGHKARSHRAFVRSFAKRRDVVVTHHMPHPACIHPRYADSSLNRYFLHDVGDIVGKPGLWIHGHTHTTVDTVVGNTRILCNPLGYVNTHIADEPNPRFDPGLVVEL